MKRHASLLLLLLLAAALLLAGCPTTRRGPGYGGPPHAAPRSGMGTY